ncbi:uncharacterized protein MONBRDRAFT_34521 [Monosiga brevicollis MX1]|uniref:Kinesin-like protein n=1 Tax=Monosiga brevicollis TaxID=81824 RepID=A9VC95_MONBE|nr:uncharacterized protein MONBRDRAFT_34521 [Monosiga brevicollis MX1]EDQ84821.1 predicted protein [Monosiga brevicollis MX1]|eukprot:XP_001750322.1 hypothetical protein [Monosiga brevicollis MX1]
MIVSQTSFNLFQTQSSWCRARRRSDVFEFDRAYGPQTRQSEVYQDVSPIITSCIDGYNVCFLAFGQTGSGKTYTMMGPPENPGVNRVRSQQKYLSCICHVVDCARQFAFQSHLMSLYACAFYTMTLSLMEIYNENIYDLLRGDHRSLRIRMEESGRSYVEHLTVREVATEDDVTRVLEEGDRNRTVAATSMNIHSSRSHLLLEINIHGVNRITGVNSHGKLTLCDLAGSERVGRSQATGQRLVEAAAINKSLQSLSLVFQAIAGKQKHVPYRNCKLTHVLQDSLGGDAKCCVFINISPAESNLGETVSTLTFGQNISRIELGPVKRNVAKPRFDSIPR